MPVGDRRRLSDDLVSKAWRDGAKAHGCGHGRGGTAADCALNLDRFGEAGVSERSPQSLVEQDVCPNTGPEKCVAALKPSSASPVVRAADRHTAWLKVAVHDARLATRYGVQVDERIDGLRHDTQPLSPRQRLWIRFESEPAETPATARISRPQPVLQRPASHERKDEARRLLVEAVVEQRQQVRVAAPLQQLHLQGATGRLSWSRRRQGRCDYAPRA